MAKFNHLEKKWGEFIFRDVLKDPFYCLEFQSPGGYQQNAEFLEWTNAGILDVSNKFLRRHAILEQVFVKKVGRIFQTGRFEIFIKRILVDYFLLLFRVLEYSEKEIILEDCLLNRFGWEEYRCAFSKKPSVRWRKPAHFVLKICGALFQYIFMFTLTFNRGIRLSGKRKKYKIMREALWGLYDTGGYYAHDDFIVDGQKIKKEDLVLFSRGKPQDECRLKGYQDARDSVYEHFNLKNLPIALRTVFKRIFPLYFRAGGIFLSQLGSPYYTFFLAAFSSFVKAALPYEKIFSSYKIDCELAHNMFHSSHIPEAIVCQNHGARYYFFNWSDLSIDIARYHVSHMACDRYLVWGRAQICETGGERAMYQPIGYLFKSFICKVRNRREEVLRAITQTDLEMGEDDKRFSYSRAS